MIKNIKEIDFSHLRAISKLGEWCLVVDKKDYSISWRFDFYKHILN